MSQYCHVSFCVTKGRASYRAEKKNSLEIICRRKKSIVEERNQMLIDKKERL